MIGDKSVRPRVQYQNVNASEYFFITNSVLYTNLASVNILIAGAMQNIAYDSGKATFVI
ncbi:MAG: hypothetical protein ACRD8W_20730 [Nitrososphaeraceae archaeon]